MNDLDIRNRFGMLDCRTQMMLGRLERQLPIMYVRMFCSQLYTHLFNIAKGMGLDE